MSVMAVLALLVMGSVSGSVVYAAEGGNDDQVCEGLDSTKIDTPSNPLTVTVTAPDGKLIDGYCVKAGSVQQGNGPVYINVDPPVKTLTFGYPGNKTVSHYSLSYTTAPTDACPDLGGNQPPDTDCTQPPNDRETRDVPGGVNCETDTYVIEHQERTREYSWDGDSWEPGEWSAWSIYGTTVIEATDEQCPPEECPEGAARASATASVDCEPPPVVINPGGSIEAGCTGEGVAHADNSASTTSVGFEVVVNGNATLYVLAAGEVRDIPFSGATTGNTVILQDGEANVIDAALVPPKCEVPPVECPEDEMWLDDNDNGIVEPQECVHTHHDPPPPPAGDDDGINPSSVHHESPFLANTGAEGPGSSPMIPIGLMAALLFGLALFFVPGRKAGAKR